MKALTHSCGRVGVPIVLARLSELGGFDQASRTSIKMAPVNAYMVKRCVRFVERTSFSQALWSCLQARAQPPHPLLTLCSLKGAVLAQTHKKRTDWQSRSFKAVIF